VFFLSDKNITEKSSRMRTASIGMKFSREKEAPASALGRAQQSTQAPQRTSQKEAR
jgi:hypothetical protein